MEIRAGNAPAPSDLQSDISILVYLRILNSEISLRHSSTVARHTLSLGGINSPSSIQLDNTRENPSSFVDDRHDEPLLYELLTFQPFLFAVGHDPRIESKLLDAYPV